jgi:hypothetical protein
MPQGGPQPSARYVERQALTRSPATPATPSGKTSNDNAFLEDRGTVTPGDGLVISQAMAIVVSLYPDPGITLSGGGSLLCWVYNPYQQRWTRCDDLDIDLSNTSGYPAFTKGAYWNVSRLGMLINWLTSSVTASGGASSVVVRLDAFTSVGGQAA